MNDTIFDDNKVELVGTLEEDLVKHSTERYLGFYTSKLSVKRISGYQDILEVSFPEEIFTADLPKKGDKLKIEGKFRSRNKFENGKSKLKLYVWAISSTVVDVETPDVNKIILTGHICKPVILRETLRGYTISDMMLASNRPVSHKSDYIPCIAWGRNAKYSSILPIGSKLHLTGRIQSRQYIKVEGENSFEKTAFEVSINEISLQY